MVVSFEIHTVLTVIEVIALLVNVVLGFAWKKKNWNKTTQLTAISVINIVNVVQLPMEILEGWQYSVTIATIIFWSVMILLLALDDKNKN